MKAKTVALVLGLLSVAGGCSTRPDSHCDPGISGFCDEQPGGHCLVAPPDRYYCAYADTACPSGMQWSEGASSDIAGECVSPETADASIELPDADGTMDAGVDASAEPTDAGFDAQPPVILPPVTNGQSASLVLGQPNFQTSTEDNGGLGAGSLDRPTDVATDGTRLWVADNSNARILQWSSAPVTNQAGANIAIGQVDLTTAGGGLTQSKLQVGGLRVCVAAGRVFVSDTYNHRVLIFTPVPSASGGPAAVVLGQTTFTTKATGKAANELNSPRGLWCDGSRLVVVDGGNSRVLIWTSIPTTNGAAANIVLGRAAFGIGSGDPVANPPTAASMQSPNDVFFDGTRLFVADASNNRVMVWQGMPTSNGEAADYFVGQSSGTTNTVDAGLGSVNERGLRAPGAVVVAYGSLFVADTENYRVVVFTPVPTSSGASAARVLGQTSLTGRTEPAAPSASAIWQPRDIGVMGDYLYVTDWGWHRVTRFLLSH